MAENGLGSIVHEYRKELGNEQKAISLRNFAFRLCQPLTVLKVTISHETVRAWELGFSNPKDEFLHALTMFAEPNSWQWKFAQDCKAAIYPSIHEPVGEIGKRIKATVAAG